jgi:hypothetical protein
MGIKGNKQRIPALLLALLLLLFTQQPAAAAHTKLQKRKILDVTDKDGL